MNMDMRYLLLVAVASLMALSAGAQPKRSAPIPQRTQSLSQVITEDVKVMNRSDGKIRSVEFSSRQPYVLQASRWRFFRHIDDKRWLL